MSMKITFINVKDRKKTAQYKETAFSFCCTSDCSQ